MTPFKFLKSLQDSLQHSCYCFNAFLYMVWIFIHDLNFCQQNFFKCCVIFLRKIGRGYSVSEYNYYHPNDVYLWHEYIHPAHEYTKARTFVSINRFVWIWYGILKWPVPVSSLLCFLCTKHCLGSNNRFGLSFFFLVKWSSKCPDFVIFTRHAWFCGPIKPSIRSRYSVETSLGILFSMN